MNDNLRFDVIVERTVEGSVVLPSDPDHVEALLDHIAHLEDGQVDTIHETLHRWWAKNHEQASRRTAEQKARDRRYEMGQDAADE